LTNAEGVLRKELWLRHGHQGLYGDDGEMQCGTCGLDYKRDSAEKIAARLLELDYRKDAEELASK
jgi:hypothetical protein